MVHFIPYIILCSCLIGWIPIEDVACVCVIYVYIVSMTTCRGREGKRRFPFPLKYSLMNNYNNLYDYSIPNKLKESCSEAMQCKYLLINVVNIQLIMQPIYISIFLLIYNNLSECTIQQINTILLALHRIQPMPFLYHVHNVLYNVGTTEEKIILLFY